MTLYNINSQIDQILSSAEVDETTGEVLFDTTLLESLQIARETKLENIACYVKNLNSDIEALKTEEKNILLLLAVDLVLIIRNLWQIFLICFILEKAKIPAVFF